jgi:adenylylsulfate kinase-like enzyme
MVIWIVGLSGSGKTLLAKNLQLRLNQQNITNLILSWEL